MTEQAILGASSAPITPPQAANPANPAQRRVTEATRIPMNLPQTKLSVPEIPGYYLYWHLGQNVHRAIQGGYEFVDETEVDVVNTGLADNASKQGNSDMGTRISMAAGGLIEGSAELQRLYLMKLRNEWRALDVKALEAVNERVAASIRGGRAPAGATGGPAETSDDQLKKYLKKGQDLFIPKRH